MKEKPCRLQNGQAIPFSQVPCIGLDEFRQEIIDSTHLGARISSLFGMDPRAPGAEKSDALRLIAVLSDDNKHLVSVFSTEVEQKYPSLTPLCPQAHMFEREIAEQWGVIPEGHPWLKPVRFQPPFRSGKKTASLPAGLPSKDGGVPGSPQPASRTDGDVVAGQVPPPGVLDFFRIEGEEIHEVAVGPVHAGVIEPGHFRFQCHGEKVFHLEISLGYQHRGIERALIGGPAKRTLSQMETIAGDTTVGHNLAYCHAIEALSGCEVPGRAQAIRAIGLELERLANHTGDLGALCGDVGFLPTSSYCGRIRGDFLNATALICGSRLGRGLIRPGGVVFDIDPAERLVNLIEVLSKAEKDVGVAVQLMWDSPTVMGRFENTGTISRGVCRDLGMVGPAARACGFQLDARADFPSGHYRISKILPVPNPELRTGDVAARAYVRWAEIQNSLSFIKDLLPYLPKGSIFSPDPPNIARPFPSNLLVVSMVEGWRGEICHTAITDSQGRFAIYKIVDPSFHNWFGLGMALRNQEISDFPLCNKSFNLSYCGFDL